MKTNPYYLFMLKEKLVVKIKLLLILLTSTQDSEH
jgi:hypothetical protein